MPVDGSIVGMTSHPAMIEVDARWLMAFAAAFGEESDRYFDTTRPDGIASHPLFPVCVEFAAAQAQPLPLGDLRLDEVFRMLHVSHDLHIHRPIRPGDRLAVHAQVEGVERKRNGTFVLLRWETKDSERIPVATSWQGILFRDVELTGDDRPAHGAPALPASVEGANLGEESTIHIPAGMPHVYTECARIPNPIHTDRAFAASVGLPTTILHGTATLGLAVSRVLATQAGSRPETVRRVAAHFKAAVPVPSGLTFRIVGRTSSSESTRIFFEVRTPMGGLAIKSGLVELAVS